MTERPENLPEPRWLTDEEQVDWRAFLHGARLLEAALDSDLSAHGISSAEYEILSMVSEAPDMQMRMSALADLVVQSRSRVTHTAARLESRGLVQRRPSPDDGRGVELALTAKGRELLDWLAVVHLHSVRRHFVDLLTPEQFRAVGEAMSIIRAHGRPRQ
ncbi:MAG: MarR family transcriptional regulator [Intrasporangiaceae bacterium]|nr:MarR family transcriptional regulator [Intrasporangiaceae bacterium]